MQAVNERMMLYYLLIRHAAVAASAQIHVVSTHSSERKRGLPCHLEPLGVNMLLHKDHVLPLCLPHADAAALICWRCPRATRTRASRCR